MTTSTKPLNLKCISNEVIVTDKVLGTILTGLCLNPQLRVFNSDPDTEYQLKMVVLSQKGYADRKFIICFAFDRKQKGKLIRLDPATLHTVVSNVCRELDLKDSNVAIQLIGRIGSRNSCKLSTCFDSFECAKVIVQDFSATSTSISDFLRMNIDDLDRVTTKLDQLSNVTRIEMASLPQSEKKIRLDDSSITRVRNEIMFANQMLQIPGITEKVALTVAKRFSTPKQLIAYIDSGNVLEDTEVENNSGERKRYGESS